MIIESIYPPISTGEAPRTPQEYEKEMGGHAIEGAMWIPPLEPDEDTANTGPVLQSPPEYESYDNDTPPGSAPNLTRAQLGIINKMKGN